MHCCSVFCISSADSRLELIFASFWLRFCFQDSGIAKAFNVCLDVPPVRGPEEIAAALRDHSADRYMFPESEIEQVGRGAIRGLLDIS